MAAVVLVTDFTSFLARGTQVVGGAFPTDFATAVGKKLAVSGAIGPEVFSASGTVDAAEVGAVLALMSSLDAAVNWSTTVFVWVGATDLMTFCYHNQTLLALIVKAVVRSRPSALAPRPSRFSRARSARTRRLTAWWWSSRPPSRPLMTS